MSTKEAYYDIIRAPIITEKATVASEQGKVIFEVAQNATKQQIKEAVEALFKTKVVSVNTLNIKGKNKKFRGVSGKRSIYKKALITLADGKTIDVSAGV